MGSLRSSAAGTGAFSFCFATFPVLLPCAALSYTAVTRSTCWRMGAAHRLGSAVPPMGRGSAWRPPRWKKAATAAAAVGSREVCAAISSARRWLQGGGLRRQVTSSSAGSVTRSSRFWVKEAGRARLPQCPTTPDVAQAAQHAQHVGVVCCIPVCWQRQAQQCSGHCIQRLDCLGLLQGSKGGSSGRVWGFQGGRCRAVAYVLASTHSRQLQQRVPITTCWRQEPSSATAASKAPASFSAASPKSAPMGSCTKVSASPQTALQCDTRAGEVGSWRLVSSWTKEDIRAASAACYLHTRHQPCCSVQDCGLAQLRVRHQHVGLLEGGGKAGNPGGGVAAAAAAAPEQEGQCAARLTDQQVGCNGRHSAHPQALGFGCCLQPGLAHHPAVHSILQAQAHGRHGAGNWKRGCRREGRMRPNAVTARQSWQRSGDFSALLA